MRDGRDVPELCRAVYVSARAGDVDCDAAFDLAVACLEYAPLDADARELGELAAEGLAAGRERMAAVALRVIDAMGFEPGFEEEPGWRSALEEALRLVNRDAAATGVPGPCRFDTYDDWITPRGRPFVRAWDGHCGHGSGVAPSAGAAPETALLAVADDAQDAIMEALWSAWPVCPDHNLGLHAESRDGTPVWWCHGARHAVAPIGCWPPGR